MLEKRSLVAILIWFLLLIKINEKTATAYDTGTAETIKFVYATTITCPTIVSN
jgi:hypothetical protein